MSRSFQRRAATRDIGRKIIIACEGEKTEHGYFEAIRQSLRLSTVKVRVVKPPGSDPLSVVRAAIEGRDMIKMDHRWVKGDMAWAVFDGDEHIANNPTNWYEALQIADSQGIFLAVSNPCFEFWYLLHFQDQWADITRQKARDLLKKHLHNYEKADQLYPMPLEPLTLLAKQRAAELTVRATTNELPLHTNPCTGVWILVDSLIALRN